MMRSLSLRLSACRRKPIRAPAPACHVTFVTLPGRQVSWIIPVRGLVLIAAVVAYVAGIAAVRLLGSRLASFVGLAEVLFAVVLASLLLEQRLDATQLARGSCEMRQ